MADTRFSTGEGSMVLGLKTSSLIANINRAGCPDASIRIGGRRCFTLDDLHAIRRWYQARGKPVNFINEAAFA